MRRVLVAALALTAAVTSCTSSDGSSPRDPFPDARGPVLVPDDLDDDWTVRMAFSDTAPDPSAHTYLRGGDEPVTVHRVGDGFVFEMPEPREDLGLEPGWSSTAFVGIAEGEVFVLDEDAGASYFWGRDVGRDEIEDVARGDGGTVEGRLPRGWKGPLAGPAFAVDLGDGRMESHVSIRRSPPAEQAAFRALMKGADVAARYSTEASIQDPITTDPARDVRVRGRDAIVGPLSSGLRALVVEGDPGLTVLTSGNRLANFVSDDGLVEIAGALRTGTVDELDAWLARVLEEEIAVQLDDTLAIGEPMLQVEASGRSYVVLDTPDDLRCIVIRAAGSRFGVDHWCASPSDIPFATLMRPDEVGPGTPSFAIVAGIANEHAAISLELPDGSMIRAEEHVLDPGGLAFFADVSGYATGEIVVTIDAERIVIDPAAHL